MTPEQRTRKLTEARARYGKPFVTETLIRRSTEPSFVLREIVRRSEEAAVRKTFSNVVPSRDLALSGRALFLRGRGCIMIGQIAQEEIRKAGNNSEKEDKKRTLIESTRYA